MNHDWIAGVVGIVSVIAIAAYNEIVSRILPKRATALQRRDREGAIRLAERLLRLPTIGGERKKVRTRLILATNYMVLHRYEEAIGQYDIILRLRMPASLRADILRKRGDCYDALGKTEQADADRESSLKYLSRPSSPSAQPLAFVAEARLLDGQQKFAEAVDVYQRALAALPNENVEIRGEVLAKATTSAIQAGRPDLTVQFAEEALTICKSEMYRRVCHSMAATAYSNLGDLGKVRGHADEALKMARALGDNQMIAKCLGTVTGIQRNAGEIEASIATAHEAIAVDPKERIPHTYLYYAHMLIGDFDAAYEDALAVKAGSEFFIPSAQKRMDALASILLASHWIERGEPEKALECHGPGYEVFSTDRLMSVFCRSLLAWIDAAIGRTEDARALVSQVDALLPDLKYSRGSLIDNYRHLVDAELVLGEPKMALGYCEALLRQNPYPIDLPRANLRAGDAYAALGDMAAARDRYAAALECPVETRFHPIARQHLEDLDRSQLEGVPK